MSTERIVRAHAGGFGLARGATGDLPTLRGHFSVFNQWANIESVREGKFLERVAPGAFAKTFSRDRDALRVLFNHGTDPSIGEKPLGPITVLQEDERGAYYEVPLLDTAYNRELIPGLRAGVYGSSFRFTVEAEDFQPRVKRSTWNPDALPERTIIRAHLFEMGPVVFPAYPGATAGIRSLTDRFG
jgi:HK97 family phage prohead protease